MDSPKPKQCSLALACKSILVGRRSQSTGGRAVALRRVVMVLSCRGVANLAVYSTGVFFAPFFSPCACSNLRDMGCRVVEGGVDLDA